jgi:glycosyltransferase involved in cell wall biosynthesis
MRDKANHLISITIPTYNRALLLDASLDFHIPIARKHNIKIFISDNASSDNTSEVVKRRCAEYPLIFYSRNEINIGLDANVEQALKLADTKYVWLLGDSYKIPEIGLNYLVNLLSYREITYDLIVFNWKNRVKNIVSQDFNDPNKMLSDIGWHMTCLSTLVYRSDMLRLCNFKKYMGTYFLQTGIIFEYIAIHKHLVHWNRDISVESNFINGVKNKNTWAKYRFEIWFDLWPKLIFSLSPIFLLSSKIKVIKDHGLKSRVFSIKNLMVMRCNNELNLSICKKYRYIMPNTISTSRALIFLCMSILPIFVIKFFKWLFRKYI